MRALTTRLCLALLLPPLAGCATLRATAADWTQDEDGLSRPQRTVRAALAAGDVPALLAEHDDDELLQVLQAATGRYYAAQYAQSAALLDTAALLVDARLTTSLSRNGLALVTNDMARPYQPGRTERLFVAYYGMLAYVQLARWEDAAVEARRLVTLLHRFAPDAAPGERPLHAALYALAGAVFERAGEPDDAAVAWRNAHARVPAYPPAPPSPRGDSGDVLLVVERGFVAHRATESFRVPVGDPHHDRRRAQEHETDDDDDELAADAERWVRIAVPTLRRAPSIPERPPELLVDGRAANRLAQPLAAGASVDDGSAADEARDRVGTIAREVARATTRFALARAVRGRAGETSGRVVAIAAALTARADVRSWHLLPQRVNLVRVRLPVGTHAIALRRDGDTGGTTVNVGALPVARGRTTIGTIRLWREPRASASGH